MSRHRRPQRREETKEMNNKMNNNSFLKNVDLNSIAALVNSIDINQVMTEMQGMTENNGKTNEGGNISATESRKKEILNALTTIINADRSELIEVVLQLYAKSKGNNKNNIR